MDWAWRVFAVEMPSRRRRVMVRRSGTVLGGVVELFRVGFFVIIPSTLGDLEIEERGSRETSVA